MLQITALAREPYIILNHIPNIHDTIALYSRTSDCIRFPTRFGRREERQGVLEAHTSCLSTLDIGTVALVDSNTVGHLHDTTLDTLELVARTSHLQEEEEVHHRVGRSLGLTNANRLHDDGIEASCLAEHDGLARLTRYTTQTAC